HDPEEIWESVVGCVRDVLEHVPHASVLCVGVTNQRETAVVWDGHTGEPLHNAIVWQCRRTADRCAEIGSQPEKRELIRHLTGLPVDAYFSATKVEWLLSKVPAVRNAASRGRLRFGTVDSWLLWKLTGGQVHATEPTNAARTMLFDIQRREWSRELCELFSVPLSALPDVLPSAGAFGQTAPGTGLPGGVPICGVAGDQQSALFGQACYRPGNAKNTYGTGAFLLMNAGTSRPADNGHLITTLGCGASGETVYVLEGAIFTAGAVIQWLRDGLGLLESAEASGEMAESVLDNGGVYFVPALVGLGAPYWDSDVRGAICGITRGTTRNHIVRAALEAMCYRTREVIDAMSSESGLSITELRVDGGASKNDFLCQYQADVLGIDVVRPKDVESTARGAAYLAGFGYGVWGNAGELERFLDIDRVFSPAMDEVRVEQYWRGWLRAVGQARHSRDL
ncbi:MAG: FGGY family carbohydrate kinase, partial [Chloroflexota bacterium]